MSEFHVTLTKILDVYPHPNADTLSVVRVFNYSIITKNNLWNVGDYAVYIPVDSVLPDTEDWHYMCPKDNGGNRRYSVGNVPQRYRTIEAKKIRGILSQGLLVRAPPGVWSEGDSLKDYFGITKWEPVPDLVLGGEAESPPDGWHFSSYTDIEGIKRHPDILREFEPVVITEKIHGANARYVHDGSRLWVGSHGQIKRFNETSIWWRVAQKEDLEKKLARAPMHIFFGEVYGNVQDLKYGIPTDVKFKAFDVFSINDQKFLNHEDAISLSQSLGVEWVPILYKGQWYDKLMNLSDGESQLGGNMREGFVVKPLIERWDSRVGRVILKRHGDDFLLRKKR